MPVIRKGAQYKEQIVLINRSLMCASDKLV